MSKEEEFRNHLEGCSQSREGVLNPCAVGIQLIAETTQEAAKLDENLPRTFVYWDDQTQGY
jgi:hypothetical protein